MSRDRKEEKTMASKRMKAKKSFQESQRAGEIKTWVYGHLGEGPSQRS